MKIEKAKKRKERRNMFIKNNPSAESL